MLVLPGSRLRGVVQEAVAVDPERVVRRRVLSVRTEPQLAEERAGGVPLGEAHLGRRMVVELVADEELVEHVADAVVGDVHEARFVYEVARRPPLLPRQARVAVALGDERADIVGRRIEVLAEAVVRPRAIVLDEERIQRRDELAALWSRIDLEPQRIGPPVEHIDVIRGETDVDWLRGDRIRRGGVRGRRSVRSFDGDQLRCVGRVAGVIRRSPAHLRARVDRERGWRIVDDGRLHVDEVDARRVADLRLRERQIRGAENDLARRRQQQRRLRVAHIDGLQRGRRVVLTVVGIRAAVARRERDLIRAERQQLRTAQGDLRLAAAVVRRARFGHREQLRMHARQARAAEVARLEDQRLRVEAEGRRHRVPHGDVLDLDAVRRLDLEQLEQVPRAEARQDAANDRHRVLLEVRDDELDRECFLRVVLGVDDPGLVHDVGNHRPDDLPDLLARAAVQRAVSGLGQVLQPVLQCNEEDLGDLLAELFAQLLRGFLRERRRLARLPVFERLFPDVIELEDAVTEPLRTVGIERFIRNLFADARILRELRRLGAAVQVLELRQHVEQEHASRYRHVAESVELRRGAPFDRVPPDRQVDLLGRFGSRIDRCVRLAELPRALVVLAQLVRRDDLDLDVGVRVIDAWGPQESPARLGFHVVRVEQVVPGVDAERIELRVRIAQVGDAEQVRIAADRREQLEFDAATIGGVAMTGRAGGADSVVGRREQARRQRLEREVRAEFHGLASQRGHWERQRADQDGDVMRSDQRDHRRQQRGFVRVHLLLSYCRRRRQQRARRGQCLHPGPNPAPICVMPVHDPCSPGCPVPVSSNCGQIPRFACVPRGGAPRIGPRLGSNSDHRSRGWRGCDKKKTSPSRSSCRNGAPVISRPWNGSRRSCTGS